MSTPSDREIPGRPDPADRLAAAAGTAARSIASAYGILVGAGAGIGVDSGLPDFRGTRGFWNAYPPYAEKGLQFTQVASPEWFTHDPEFAWGFYGHRLRLYRETVPHPGFGILRSWAERCPAGAFVFTSNVDGQFQRADFPESRIAEAHGTIRLLQCSDNPDHRRFPAGDLQVAVDESTMRALPPLPECPDCGATARPNILMFGDYRWNPERTRDQLARYRAWLDRVRGRPCVVIEIGAGTAVPTVRYECENAARALGAPLIRVNPREPHGPSGTIALALGALEALELIAEALDAPSAR